MRIIIIGFLTTVAGCCIVFGSIFLAHFFYITPKHMIMELRSENARLKSEILKLQQ